MFIIFDWLNFSNSLFLSPFVKRKIFSKLKSLLGAIGGWLFFLFSFGG
jgi:hypothetical protein